MVEYEPAPPPVQAPPEMPPRNFLEYVAKTLQSTYSKRKEEGTDPYALLDIDLVLSNLSPQERDATSADLEALTSILRIQQALRDEHENNGIKLSNLDVYDMRFRFRVESSRGLEGKTLDAVTKQRIEQSSRHEEKVSGEQKKPWYRSVV